MEFTQTQFDWLVGELQGRRHFALACYQPRFIVENIIENCAFHNRVPEISEALVGRALDHLYPQEV